MTSPIKITQTVRQIALSLPEATEGIVCQRAAFEAGNKRFLFLEAKSDSCLLMLKLQDLLAEANRLAAKFPDCYQVGATGWVTAIFTRAIGPPPGLLKRWVDESYQLLVPRKLTALITDRSGNTSRLNKPLRKRVQSANRVRGKKSPMSPRDFRKTALSFPETVEASHMGHPDFRVRGKIFATLGPDEVWGMAKLTPEQQMPLVQDQPAIFQPASGAWGRRGCTIIQLKKADKRLVRLALLFAWRNTAPKRLVQEYDGETTP